MTFDDVAARTGLGRATLYRNSDLRRIIEEHRARGKEAHTLSGLTTEIAHLRIALDAIATTVRRHEEELRRLRKTQRWDTATLKGPNYAQISRITVGQRLHRIVQQPPT